MAAEWKVPKEKKGECEICRTVLVINFEPFGEVLNECKHK